MTEPIEAECTVHRTFRKSDTIGKLAEALAKAQAEMGGARRDSSNPFFKSKYADLASVRDACFGPLTANGLSVIQFPRGTEHGVEVETLLCHLSGEWVSDTLAVPVAKMDAQGVGSAITYARRYALAAIAGVAPEDDDGNAAAASVAKVKEVAMDKLRRAAAQGVEPLKKAWEALPPDGRKMCQAELPALKEQAANVKG